MKKKVILTKNYLQPAIDRLNEVFDLVVAEESGKSGKDLATVVRENADAEALISFLSDKIDRELMDLAPNLKIIANYAVGYNNIDVAAALEKRVAATAGKAALAAEGGASPAEVCGKSAPSESAAATEAELL